MLCLSLGSVGSSQQSPTQLTRGDREQKERKAVQWGGGGRLGGGGGREREGEEGKVDGYDRNNETKQDRRSGEEGDERRKLAECHFTLRHRNLRRSSHEAERRRGRVIGGG